MSMNELIDADDFVDIESPEGQAFGHKQEGFSHPNLVQSAYMKCITALSKEMKQGHVSIVQDSKGKPIPVYFEDTRLTAIACIETLKNVTISDLSGTESETKIKTLLKELEETKKLLLIKQKEWWNKLYYDDRERFKRQGIYFVEDSFLKDMDYKEDYIYAKLDIYRKIFEEIEYSLATNRYFEKKKMGNRVD